MVGSVKEIPWFSLRVFFHKPTRPDPDLGSSPNSFHRGRPHPHMLRSAPLKKEVGHPNLDCCIGRNNQSCLSRAFADQRTVICAEEVR